MLTLTELQQYQSRLGHLRRLNIREEDDYYNTNEPIEFYREVEYAIEGYERIIAEYTEVPEHILALEQLSPRELVEVSNTLAML